LIYTFCVIGILISLNSFRLDLFKTLTRQEEIPVGTITFKYKAAQRRFVDRVLWDRLQRESPVYDGDFIRTAELSEATVTFGEGGAVVNLPENSLIQLHNDGDIRVNINEGEVGASAEAAPLILVSGNSLVTVETGAVVTAGVAEDDFMLRVMEGTAAFVGPGGAGNVSAGETLALNEEGPRLLREATALFPRLQARFLNPNPGKLAVPFRWNRANLSPEAIIRLEIAGDRAFSRVVFTGVFTGDEASVELEPGSYFWRLSQAHNEEPGSNPPILSFKIISAVAPLLITPVEGYRYQFRVKKPSVRFQWTETEEAASYVLEAADNPQMINPVLSEEVRGTSFNFSGLGPGTWRWRVRPVFLAGYQGTLGEVSPASFTIVQSESLRTPELRSPPNQGTINVADGQGDVYFSWKPETEASFYRIRISANQDLSSPVIDGTARDNFYVYQTGQNAITPGQYYWGVLQTDIEGNDSALSPVRSFVALEGEMIQRLIFPPDGYSIEAALLPAIRFAWKTNLPFQTRFQISKTPAFSSLFVDEAADSSALGPVLSEGTWYWRIQATDPGGAVFETPPRSFIVAPPLSAPLLLEPPPDQWASIQEGKPLTFSWTALVEAEYYQLKVYHGKDRNNPIYENNLIEGTGDTLSLDGRPEGDYYWRVRGMAAENSRSTRRTGLFAEGSFSARKFRPVSLDYPANDTVFDGLQAYYTPETLRWSSEEQVGTSRFILSSRSDFAGELFALIHNPPQDIALPALGAGDYYWTIRAETPDGHDISAGAPGRFRVLPMPPLPRADRLLPENGKVIGGAELRANRRILFSWNPVAGATGYLLTLISADTGKTILQQGPVAGTSWPLEDLSLLDVGTFVWQLEAVIAEPAGEGRGNPGRILRRGEIGESRFTINFNMPSAPKLREPETLYGRE
jgi:hypothetical protein